MEQEKRGDRDRRQIDRRKEGVIVQPDGAERRKENRRQNERRNRDE